MCGFTWVSPWNALRPCSPLLHRHRLEDVLVHLDSVRRADWKCYSGHRFVHHLGHHPAVLHPHRPDFVHLADHLLVHLRDCSFHPPGFAIWPEHPPWPYQSPRPEFAGTWWSCLESGTQACARIDLRTEQHLSIKIKQPKRAMKMQQTFEVQITSRKLMFIQVSQLTRCPLYVSPFFSSTNYINNKLILCLITIFILGRSNTFPAQSLVEVRLECCAKNLPWDGFGPSSASIAATGSN